MEKSRLSRLIEELGLAAAKPAHTEERPEAHTPEVSNADVEGALELSSSEDLEAPITESFSEWSRKRMLNEYNPYVQKRMHLDGVDKGGFRSMSPDEQRNWISRKLGGIPADSIPQEARSKIAMNMAGAVRDTSGTGKNLVSRVDRTKTGEVFRIGTKSKGIFGGEKFVDSKEYAPVKFVSDSIPSSSGGQEEIRQTVLTAQEPRRFQQVRVSKPAAKPAQAPQPAAAAPQPQPAAQGQQSQQPTPREGSNRP